MSDQGTTNVPETENTLQDKGKGKAVEEHADSAMEEDEEESEESGAEEPQEEAEEEDDDDMVEIDTDNIIADGRRTRGRDIDFAKAAEEMPEEDAEEDEDDEDFEEPEDSEMQG